MTVTHRVLYFDSIRASAIHYEQWSRKRPFKLCTVKFTAAIAYKPFVDMSPITVPHCDDYLLQQNQVVLHCSTKKKGIGIYT